MRPTRNRAPLRHRVTLLLLVAVASASAAPVAAEWKQVEEGLFEGHFEDPAAKLAWRNTAVDANKASWNQAQIEWKLPSVLEFIGLSEAWKSCAKNTSESPGPACEWLKSLPTDSCYWTRNPGKPDEENPPNWEGRPLETANCATLDGEDPKPYRRFLKKNIVMVSPTQ